MYDMFLICVKIIFYKHKIISLEGFVQSTLATVVTQTTGLFIDIKWYGKWYISYMNIPFSSTLSTRLK